MEIGGEVARAMTGTKATVKRRQQRRRLEREAEKAQVRDAREAERQQQVEEDGCKEVRESSDNPDVEDRAASGEPTTVQDGDVQVVFNNGGEERSPEKEEDEEEEEEEEEEEGQDKGGENDGEEGQLLLTDYEKQREQRIKENAAKLATLNLPSLASSLGLSRRPQRQASRSKRKKDDDYVPSSSSDSQDSEDYDTDGENPSCQQTQQDGNVELDEEQALEQAIALSLHTPDNVTDIRSRVSRTQRNKQQISDKKGSAKKRRKGVQEQFTVEEIATIFAIIDERGTGKFSVAELERVARSHDFTWSKQEIADMIDIFDSNKDGQLDLTEFQGIFGRMNMLRMRVT